MQNEPELLHYGSNDDTDSEEYELNIDSQCDSENRGSDTDNEGDTLETIQGIHGYKMYSAIL